MGSLRDATAGPGCIERLVGTEVGCCCVKCMGKCQFSSSSCMHAFGLKDSTLAL